jgi:small subunit ribosomal protein S3
MVFKMKERIFIQRLKENVAIEEFVRAQFIQAKCGVIEVQHTPVVTRVIVHTTTPGLIIGSGGDRIRETAEMLKQQFKIDNPQIDVQKIENPDADPFIVAQNIASALETGTNFKRLGNYYLSKVLDAGAVGCEIIIAGKISGQRARSERFIGGYIKKCGEPAKKDVLEGFAVANPKLGNIGVTVRIMFRQSVDMKIKMSRAEQPVQEENVNDVNTEVQENTRNE